MSCLLFLQAPPPAPGAESNPVVATLQIDINALLPRIFPQVSTLELRVSIIYYDSRMLPSLKKHSYVASKGSDCVAWSCGTLLRCHNSTQCLRLSYIKPDM